MCLITDQSAKLYTTVYIAQHPVQERLQQVTIVSFVFIHKALVNKKRQRKGELTGGGGCTPTWGTLNVGAAASAPEHCGLSKVVAVSSM